MSGLADSHFQINPMLQLLSADSTKSAVEALYNCTIHPCPLVSPSHKRAAVVPLKIIKGHEGLPRSTRSTVITLPRLKSFKPSDFVNKTSLVQTDPKGHHDLTQVVQLHHILIVHILVQANLFLHLHIHWFHQ